MGKNGVTCVQPAKIYAGFDYACRLTIFSIITIFLLKNFSVYAVFSITQKQNRPNDLKTKNYIRIFCFSYIVLLITLELCDTIMVMGSDAWQEKGASLRRKIFLLCNSFEFVMTCCLATVIFLSAAKLKNSLKM